MKVALVTGGSKGIGLHVVLRLVNQGYKVVTCSRSKEAWSSALAEYPELSSVDYHSVDISDEHQLNQLFSYISNQYGKLEVAVNNASPALVSRGQLSEVDTPLLKETLQVDFFSQALCLRAELQLMKTGASIVNVSSINGLRPTPNASMYSASKHALEGLTRSVALENIGAGIRINAVAPGVTWTPRWEERQIESPNVRSEVSAVVPIKRFGNVDEIVNAIEFLLSDKASYVVGHTLVVDGGLSLT
ncbi:SDR family NAD(P)-dependent oxidoreductase [Vibrio barjaei]|uniref:SDR family NAD(P)-dependent oxidoreductase n=1 Tax=Vibrio barjaei TaxID=1676683 RepID=A0ABW7IRA0_9VIBR